MRIHPGQVEAARWFADWAEAYVGGARPANEPEPIWSILFSGGRRGGKTDLAVKIGCIFAVMVPRSRVWMVSPSIPESEELELTLRDILPREWFSYLGAPWMKFTLRNGSTIHLRSAHAPENLKRGRCDLAILNEGQKMAQRAYTNVRGATADTGGLTIVAANPPEDPIGQWVADFAEEVEAKRRAGRLFLFDPRQNPHIEISSLEALKHEVDERTYRQEVLGEFLVRTDVVFHSWSPRFNVLPTPELGDVTEEFTKKHLGRAFPFIVGMDFQLHPHMAAVVMKAFADPDDPKGDPLLWYTDYVLVEQGNEDDLVDALQAKGYRGETSGVIADASGKWQSAERLEGRGSFAMLEKRGWRYLNVPDAAAKRNPHISERCAVTNARMKSADGKRHLFSDPRNLDLNRALKLWENRNGVPYRRSEFAHLCDAASYPLWRFYPRKVAQGRFEYTAVERGDRRTDFEGY